MNRAGSSNHAQNTNIDSSQVPVEVLESLRNKLNQVHLSLRKLSDQVNHSRYNNKNSLPNHVPFQVLITQLHSISSILDNTGEVLKRTNVYPLPSFPTTQQEGLVTTLLRKKLLPEVEDWLDRAIEESEKGGVSIQKDDEFSQWCASTVQELRDEFQFYGFHTAEELDYLETEEGKKETHEANEKERQREELESSITGNKRPLHPNQVLKFMYRGVLK
ncbi:uncharacterized protein PRCAT00004556001 [Priceomyces carsonii]|uniref:uncharacterized protein n=1 Tax=Priceomyces carsonii TaxID=28549 RepID=UPI002EDA8806|nr:unnamed protein product [Priceomyces carsonii]